MKLFEKLKIGNVTLKNRIIMAPMAIQNECDGGYSQRTIQYYVERAKGGAGMIITGMNHCTDQFEDFNCSLLNSFHHVSRLGVLVEQVHWYGAKICIQIGPGSGYINPVDPKNPPYSASPIPCYLKPSVNCREFSKEDIQQIVRSMGYAASLAKKAHADAVEIHGYGGYIIDQFMCDLWNKRTDEYGGDLAGRMKFPLEIIASIQKYCGKDFPIIFKFTPMHGIEGGRSMEEGIEIAKILEAAGVAALHPDTGFQNTWYNIIPTVYQEKGFLLDMAAEIRKHVNIPVLGHGKLGDPELAEKAVCDGKIDGVLLGHQLLADPEWPNKVRSGRLDEIVPCIGCNECLNNGVAARIFSCSVNPLCHHEVDYAALPPAPGNKTVLVVGGGPGGMKAALTAAECGCSVQLWEKTDRLGGMLQHAGAPDFKKDVRDYVEYLIGAMLHSSVQVMLNKEATVEEILDGCFDRVIIATGSSPVVPPIPGVEHARIATDMLVDEKKPEGHVVIIGGGLVGCEVAVYCAQTAQKVTVIESLRDILLTADHCRNNDQMLRKLVADSGAEIVTSARVTGITDKGLTYQKDGQEYTLECDTVAIAVGYSANNKLIDQLEEKGKDFWAIGDAVSPGKIIDAVHSGYRAVRLMQ